MTTAASAQRIRCLCGANRLAPVFVYAAPPAGETRYAFTSGRPYHREIWRCESCGHFRSVHELDASGLYQGDYVNATYTAEGMRRAYDRIMGLDPSRSDNAGRVARVLGWAESMPSPAGRARTILDVGSGLCVFLSRMKSAGWRCTALDPDPRAVEHARAAAGVEAVCGDFRTAQGLGAFDAITFNKVLEHVPDPEALLKKAAEHLEPVGFIYLEVPDGEMAVREGADREEFHIDHWHAFSAASVVVLAGRCGYVVQALERLREPSGKYTLRAMLVMAGGARR